MIEWANANQGFIMVVLTAVYVVTTIVLVFQAKHSNKLTKEAMMRVSRPFLIIDLFPDSEFIYLRVKNTGVVPATDISVIFDKEVKAIGDSSLNEMLQKLHFIGPGIELKFLLGKRNTFMDRNRSLQNITGKLSYRSPIAGTYEESVNIDLSLCAQPVEIS